MEILRILNSSTGEWEEVPAIKGADGFSPSAKIEQTDEGAVITIVDATGSSSATIKHGEKGADGTMSFEDLTEEQKESLRGEPGPQGEVGPQGPQGEQGIQGETGPAGADGKTPVKGVDYFDGADGKTPVRGTDYWTSADQEQIVADVLAALPAAEGVSV